MSNPVEYFSAYQIPQKRLDAEKLIKSLTNPSQMRLQHLVDILKVHKINITKYPKVNFIIQAVKENDEMAFNFLINYLFTNFVEECIDYLNSKKAENCEEGYNALQYAAYYEFQDMALKLIENGADYETHINHIGDNIIHSAARGGSLKIIMKLQELGVDIYKRNGQNLSTFQLSCLEGNLHIMKYLLKMNQFDGGGKINLNEQDPEYLETPLHFAVHSTDYAVVKYLLIQGAKKNIKNKEKQTPLELAKFKKEEITKQLNTAQDEVDLDKIQSLQSESKRLDGLISLLGHISFINRLKLQTRVGPSKGMNKYSFLLKLINLLGFFGLLLIIPFVDGLIIAVVIYYIIYFLSFYFLICSSQVDPGFIQRYGYKNYQENEQGSRIPLKDIFFRNYSLLLSRKEFEELCLECCIIKPKRSKHCDFCNRCVSVMDHHCPFINQCVGSRNHKFFFFMLFTQVLSQFFILAICICALIELQENDISDEHSHFLIVNAPIIFNEIHAYIWISILLLQFIVTLFPLSFILYHQYTILIHGYTSLEMRYKGKFTEQQSQDIDQNQPVTEVPNRTKSKQYPESLSSSSTSASRIQSSDSYNQDEEDEQDEMEQTNFKDTESIYTALSAQQKDVYGNKTSISKSKNSKNSLYFGNEEQHKEIFLNR